MHKILDQWPRQTQAKFRATSPSRENKTKLARQEDNKTFNRYPRECRRLVEQSSAAVSCNWLCYLLLFVLVVGSFTSSSSSRMTSPRTFSGAAKKFPTTSYYSLLLKNKQVVSEIFIRDSAKMSRGDPIRSFLFLLIDNLLLLFAFYKHHRLTRLLLLCDFFNHSNWLQFITGGREKINKVAKMSKKLTGTQRTLVSQQNDLESRNFIFVERTFCKVLVDWWMDGWVINRSALISSFDVFIYLEHFLLLH